MSEAKSGYNKELGRRGEDWVSRILQKKGYTILERNWQCRWGEIDIIASNDREIIFLEVKTRCNDNFSKPCEAVTKSKQKKIILTAEAYLLENPEEHRQPRFDVAEVYAPQGLNTVRAKLNYISYAFGV